MNNSYKAIIAFLTGILLVAGAKAQEVQPDAIYKKVIKEYTLHQDGSWDYHYQHSLKLLTYYAFHNLYGEDFIVYNPRVQKLKINNSTTVMADGKLVTGPQNALNELLPSFAVNAAAFNHLRELAVTHTGLERGAIIDFDYTLYNSKEYASSMFGNEVLWLNSPIEQFTIIIHVPKGVTLNYSQYNFEHKPEIVKTARETEYRWNLQNLPAAGREDFRPREQQNRPRLVFSASKNFSKVLQDFSSQEAFNQKCEGELSKIADRLSSERKDPLKMMMAIQDFVVNELNYYPVPLSSAAFKLRASTQVFESNGGTEAEKAVLLCSMLNYVGIKSEVVAVMTESFYHSKSSSLAQIERFLVKTQPGLMDPIYLSPLQNDSYDQQYTLPGKLLIPILTGKADKIDNKDITRAGIDIQSSLVLDDQWKIKGKALLKLEGKTYPYLKVIQDSAYAKKLLPGLAEASEIESFSIQKMTEEGFSADYELNPLNLIKNVSEHYFLKIPVLSTGIESWHANELVSNRVEPMDLPNQASENYQYSITLPEGYELITAEENIQVKRPYGKFIFSISQTGRTIEIIKSIDIQKTSISVEEYADFRSFINSWNQRKYKECIIRIGPK